MGLISLEAAFHRAAEPLRRGSTCLDLRHVRLSRPNPAERSVRHFLGVNTIDSRRPSIFGYCSTFASSCRSASTRCRIWAPIS